MARTIATIKAELTHNYLANETIQSLYGLTSDDVDKFETTFSTLSLESIFFYVVAVSIWTLEKLFDAHKTEVTDLIATLTPHTLQWYATKAKAFQYNCELVPDTDYYDNSKLSDSKISDAKIISFAAALENSYTVYIKIATGSTIAQSSSNSAKNKGPLDNNQLSAFKSYINRIKDAGVNLEVVNANPDVLYANITIYYDPLVIASDGTADGSPVILSCILDYIQGLSFNGELRIKELEDALAEVDGVIIPEVRNAAYTSDNVNNPTAFEVPAYQKPYSGYFVIKQNDIYILANTTTKKEAFPTTYKTGKDDYSVFVKLVEYVTVQD